MIQYTNMIVKKRTTAIIECSKRFKIRACPNDICPNVVFRGDNEYVFENLETIHDGTVFSCGRKGVIMRIGNWSSKFM